MNQLRHGVCDATKRKIDWSLKKNGLVLSFFEAHVLMSKADIQARFSEFYMRKLVIRIFLVPHTPSDLTPRTH